LIGKTTGVEPMSSVPDEPEHKPLIDEVLRKVGRNLVIYQDIERLLRTCVLLGAYSGTIEDLQEQRDAKLKTTERKPMGVVGPLALDALFSDLEPASPDGRCSTAVDDTKMSVKLKIGFAADAPGRDNLQRHLAVILEHRNRLAHQLLDHWMMTDKASTVAISAKLDDERQVALNIRDHLRSIVTTVTEGMLEAMQAASNWLTDPEGTAQQLRGLAAFQQTSVVQRLIAIAGDSSHPDGWTDLAEAGRILWEELPQDMTALRDDFGLRTLKAIVRAANLFETKTETTAGRGERAYYRFVASKVGRIEVQIG